MATLDTEVRPLRAADAGRARELLRSVDEDSQPGDPQAAARAEQGFDRSREAFDFLSSDSLWFLAAERGGELVGYASVSRIPKASALLGTLYVDEVYVLSAHRRCGVGAALLSEVHRIGRSLGYWRIRLHADPNDAGVRRFYESLGFHDASDGFFQREV